MPIAQVEMDDGKLYEIEFEGNQPPSEQEIMSYIGGQQQPQQTTTQDAPPPYTPQPSGDSLPF